MADPWPLVRLLRLIQNIQMSLTRREFIKSLASPLLIFFLPASFFWKISVMASALAFKKFPRLKRGKNIFLAFNNIKNPENGESDEFTSIRNIQNILKDMDVPLGTTIIGIGARSGHPKNPYAAPGEMGYKWKFGEKWQGMVTSTVDAKPIPLELDDPIVVTQVGVLHESTAHRFVINDPSLEGSVLWTFYNDDTGSKALNVGMHNLFSDVDGGLLNEIYDVSQSALEKPTQWANEKIRSRLQEYMPNFSNDRIWDNFSKTLATPFVHSRWLSYIRNQGWPGAAVVLEGSMQNVTQFHLKEWSRKTPQEPEFEIGKGTHTFLKIKSGREARPFITNPDGTWTMVGFIWDLESQSSSPSMKTYRDFADIFGQDFHIHGFKDDQSVGGHTLFSMLGRSKLSVSLYPLNFISDETAFLFNNDLVIVPNSITQTDVGLSVIIKNSGENFVRNLSIRLSRKNIFGAHEDCEEYVVPQMRPGETLRVNFTGQTAKNPSASRCLWLDRKKHFMEGGEGTVNNRIDF